jgi:uncharacterized protein (TIGR03437 family)
MIGFRGFRTFTVARTALFLACLNSAVIISGCSGLVGATNGGGGTALTISNVATPSVTMTGAAVSWQTSISANSQVEYGISLSYGSLSPLDPTMVVGHQVTLANLRPATLYHYRVHSAGPTNTAAVSGDLTFTTVTDTTPPTISVVTPTSNATLSGTIALTATATDDVAVASVQFKVDSANTGAAITAPPYSYALNTASLSDGNHILTALATDTSGNTATSTGVPVKVNNAVPAPSITSLNPTSGLVGTSVTIAGANFGATQGASTVTFNGTTATPTSWSATSISVVVPSGATTGNVVVTVGGVASNGVGFTVTVSAPSITSLNPASGVVGTSVTINGANFGATRGTSMVTFNGIATAPASWSATSIVAPVPNGATTGNVVVTVGGVASNGVSFSVTVPAPSITSLNPTTGLVGASVTITGVNFGATQGASTVTFNGTAATPTSWSATSILAPVPNGATTGNVVATVGGVASNGVSFTVTVPAPSITSLNPASGVVGTSVTINGANFGATRGTNMVTFNGIATAPASWSATSIVAPVPSGATTGNVVVTVGGISSNGMGFTVAVPGPRITSLSPTSGFVGASVTITGVNFGATQGASTVKFNGTTATPTSWSATSIVAPVPNGATTGNVVVTVGGVASNGVIFTVTVPAPSITSLNPASGLVGTSVMITGVNFGATQGTSTVKFNGISAVPTSWSATSITALVPIGATTGNVVVTVGGLASNGVSFAVAVPPPSITSLNPASGLIGTSVTIAGANFGATQGTSAVTFNGTVATPTSWSATSISVPVPTGATTGNVVVAVSGVTSNGVTFTLTAGVLLPIKVSSNGRYLVDQNNVPWLMVSDAAHTLVCHLPQSGWTTYLADRQAKGFNSVNVFAIDAHSTCATSGAARDGTLPFTTGNGPSSYDLSTPNNAYWSEVDTLLTQAASYGLVVVLDPLITSDFLVTLRNNGTTKAFSFGAYLGTRYKNFDNIIWQSGQDFQSWHTQSDLNLVAQLMAGVASTDARHLQTIQLDYNRSYSNQATATLSAQLNLDFVYSYYETYDYILQAYNSSPSLPVILGEANYEGENNTGGLTGPANTFVVREENYWTITSGGTGGVIWGNGSVNHMDSSYPGSLQSAGAFEVAYLPKLIAPYAWWNLVPDSGHAVVTAGFGTANPNSTNLNSATYATTAWITDGSLAITYTPVATTLSVNMANFSKPMTASWYDPTTGTSTVIVGSPFPNSGSQSFTTPGAAHADGAQDWVLVLH